MAIALAGSGAFAYSAAAGASVSTAYPAGIVAGNGLLLIVGMKPSVANGGSVTTPAGWTPVGSIVGAGGYGTTLGADTGNTNLFAFFREADGTETGSLAVSLTQNNVSWAVISRLSRAGDSWNVASATGQDSTTGAAVAIAFGTDPNVQANDYIVGAMCVPTDVTTPAQFTVHGLTQTGCTFGAITELGEADSTNGNDIGGYIVHGPCTAGSSLAPATLSATAGGTTTNVRGPGIMVRLREIVLADVTAPILSGISVGSITQTGCTPTATTDEANGTAYFVVVTQGDTPSAAQIIAGQNSAGTAAVSSGSAAVSATGALPALTAAGLSAGTAYTAYIVHRDTAGNNSNIVSANFSTLSVPQSGTEYVGPFSGLDLEAHSIYRVDMIGGAYPTWLTSGATHTHEPTGGWDGGPCANITPCSVTDGYSAVGSFVNLHKNSTFAVRQLNIRFEVLFGNQFCTGQYAAAGNKFIIAHAGAVNASVSDHRPMTYLTVENSGDTISNAIAAGTVKQHDPTGLTNDWFGGSGNSNFYFTDTAAATGGIGNKPLVNPNTWVTYEVFLSGVPIAGYPNGCMKLRITNRQGTVLTTITIPWNYDGGDPWAAVDYINEVQLIGGYYNGATAAAPGNFQKISGITLAANQPDFLGPRAGFVPGATLPGTLPPELSGWTKPNDTSLRSPDGTIEIGDVMQPTFYPQFKDKQHNNQCNFSLRLALPDYTADSLTASGNEVVYGKGAIQCRFRYESGLPQTVNLGGVNYTYLAQDRFGFKVVLTSAPAQNTFDFTVNGSNIALYLQPALTAQEITDGAVRDENVVNSIVIKNTAGLLDARKSSKVAHLYRPRATDATGAGVWGDWSIVNATTIRMTFPAAWLAAATYPVSIE